MPKLPRLIAALTAGALALSACGSSDSAKPETPKQGGLLREGLVRPASLDPAFAQSVSERQMADQLYDGLTAWSPTGLRAMPALASDWQASDDDKHWTFHLRADAKAANGETVTAGDAKRSFERIARKSVGSVSTDLLSAVTGFNDFSGNDQVPGLSGLVVKDDKTLEINLDSSFADLPLLLGNPTFGVVHFGLDNKTYTTGPYMVAGTPDAAHVTLQRSPGSQGHLDTLNVSYFSDVDSSYEAFKSGTVDWTPVSPEKAAEASKAYGAQLFRPSLRTLYLSFNLTNPKLSNVQFRQAIVQAIDRSAVANKLGATTNVLSGVVPDGIPGHESSGCSAVCAHDVTRAKASLAAAFPNGDVPPIKITVTEGQPITDDVLKQITDDLSAAGINATVDRLPVDKFNTFTVDPAREVFQTSWSAAYPSGGAFLQPLFQSGLVSNVTDMNDQNTNAKIATAEATSDFNLRSQYFGDVESTVMAQVPIIPLVTFPVQSVENTRARGIEPLPTGNFDAAAAWVSSPQP